jgi:hypothetical protein
MSTDELKFTELNPPERSRTYVFPTGTVTYHNVTKVCVRPSGTHRLETADGQKHIVNPGWLSMDLDMDAWTF